MAMRLSRVLFWLAAAVAAAALFGPQRHATLLTVVAGLALLAAYGLWRTALRQQAVPASELPPAPGRLDKAALAEIAALCERCCSEAATPAAAVDGVLRVLRHELGAPRARARLETVDGAVVAQIELGETLLEIAPEDLSTLLDRLRNQLAAAGRRMVWPSP